MACWMPAGATVTGASVIGRATGVGSSQCSVIARAAPGPSTTWPGADGTPTGSMPSKRTVPSVAGRSSCGRTRSNAWPSAKPLTRVTGATSRG